MAGSTDRVLTLVALRQARRRAFNERLLRLDHELSTGDVRLFRCECGLIGCAATIKLSADDYAAIRATPRQFAVRGDHVIPEAEDVVTTKGAHAIVEKTQDGPIAATALGTRHAASAPHHRP